MIKLPTAFVSRRVSHLRPEPASLLLEGASPSPLSGLCILGVQGLGLKGSVALGGFEALKEGLSGASRSFVELHWGVEGVWGLRGCGALGLERFRTHGLRARGLFG